MARRIDVLFFTLVGLSVVVTAAIIATIVFFCLRYRASVPRERSGQSTDSPLIEYSWIVALAVIFIGIFGWATALYAELFRAPPDALPVLVVGKQWMWKLQHPAGRRELNELHVPRGQAIKVVLTSEDVIHSFSVPALRIKRDAVPGRYTSIWFTPTRTGVFHLFCAEFCGTDHARMGGRVVVMEPAAFATWLESGGPHASMAAEGERLFRVHGCSGCHGLNATVQAPRLDAVFGSVVHLDDGRSVIADEIYLRDAILVPRKDVVAGFAPIMPSFQGQLDEEQVLQLIEYVKSMQQETPQ